MCLQGEGVPPERGEALWSQWAFSLAPACPQATAAGQQIVCSMAAKNTTPSSSAESRPGV